MEYGVNSSGYDCEDGIQVEWPGAWCAPYNALWSANCCSRRSSALVSGCSSAPTAGFARVPAAKYIFGLLHHIEASRSTNDAIASSSDTVGMTVAEGLAMAAAAHIDIKSRG